MYEGLVKAMLIKVAISCVSVQCRPTFDLNLLTMIACPSLLYDLYNRAESIHLGGQERVEVSNI